MGGIDEGELGLNFRRALHLVGAGALTGALLLGSAPTASANDGIRQRQKVLGFFATDQIWQHATGKGVTVGVVDDGIHPSQPDLKGSLLAEKVFSEGHKKIPGVADDGTHGTAMAALIAAHGHGPGGKDGMMGLAPDAKILPVWVRAGVGSGPGIRYAVDHGAKIINLSHDGPNDPEEAKAVKYAISKGAIVVAGSGNDGIKSKEYPASDPGVLSVGGLGKDGGIWENSSWGSNVSLVAPADDNVTPDPDSPSGYAFTEGTSDATAYVSASAALVWQAHPNLTAGQVINRLIKTAKPLYHNEKLPNEKWGYGLVRPLRAVTYDVPKGPTVGPLAQPSKISSSDGKSSDTASNGSSSSHMPLIFGVGAVIVVGAVILVVVVAKKR